MTQKQFGLSAYQFKPSWLGALILLICVPLFIKLGFWQYGKAMLKLDIEAQYKRAADSELTHLPTQHEDFSVLQYKKVRVKGRYDIAHQILLDNQVEGNLAGYHVITPLKIEGVNGVVLVNRGWIASKSNRNDVPVFITPQNTVEIVGQLWIPSTKVFTLETDEQKQAETSVWQYLDIARYQKAVPNLLPIVIKLDEKSEAGGFVRHWEMPASKIASHLGYAYQWFGFAIASILIYFFTSFKKRNE
jgi:surfeit locus 1 family protein